MKTQTFDNLLNDKAIFFRELKPPPIEVKPQKQSTVLNGLNKSFRGLRTREEAPKSPPLTLAVAT